MRTVEDILRTINSPPGITRLDKPRYSPPEGNRDVRVGLAVASMKDHTTDEGWQLFQGLEQGGYGLCGYGLDFQHAEMSYDDDGTAYIDKFVFGPNMTDVGSILALYNPTTVVVQDAREWQGQTAGKGFDERERFRNVGQLRLRPDIFRLTVLKDAHQRPQYHRDSAEEIGCHAWITYYHPDIVCKFAPYVRKEHLVRTYHSVDSKIVPEYSSDRPHGCLLSGAVSSAYPLRSRLFRESRYLHHTTTLPHPGYHRRGSATPGFLQLLSKYKVAICTSSAYGYVLRKIIEATACGCVAITDLPKDEVLNGIDGNLWRVPPDISIKDMADVINAEIKLYNSERQAHYAEVCKELYDYRVQGVKLSNDIEALRRRYNEGG